MLHLVGCLYYLYQWCTVKQISDNEIYLLIKYVKRVFWRVAKCLSYIEEARCITFNPGWGCKATRKSKGQRFQFCKYIVTFLNHIYCVFKGLGVLHYYYFVLIFSTTLFLYCLFSVCVYLCRFCVLFVPLCWLHNLHLCS